MLQEMEPNAHLQAFPAAITLVRGYRHTNICFEPHDGQPVHHADTDSDGGLLQQAGERL